MEQSDFVIGFGSNLGERLATLRSALGAIAALDGVTLTGCAAVYESVALDPGQPAYLNSAARIRAQMTPSALLRLLHRIEAEHGRERTREGRRGSRTLDLDILWSTRPVAVDGLTIPHPGLLERWFALQPLLDVAPELEAQLGKKLQALGGRRAHHAALRGQNVAEARQRQSRLQAAPGMR